MVRGRRSVRLRYGNVQGTGQDLRVQSGARVGFWDKLKDKWYHRVTRTNSQVS